MKKTLFLVLITLSFAAGCSSKSKGFNRGQLHNSMNEIIVTDKNIKDTLALKPQLPSTFKLGVYFTEPQKENYSTPEIRWMSEDKEAFINSLSKELVSSKKLSQIITISSATVSKENLKNIRLAAAQHGVDAVMVISTANAAKQQLNSLAWSYLALAPAYFVNGNVSKSLVISQATLWDVRNQFLYMTAEAENYQKLAYPAFNPKEEKLVEETKRASFKALSKEVSKQFKQLL